MFFQAGDSLLSFLLGAGELVHLLPSGSKESQVLVLAWDYVSLAFSNRIAKC